MARSREEAKERLPPLVFFRITLIGSSGCGKTSLINSFVNGVCPVRYTKTDRAVLYYKKTEIDDEGEYEDVRKPVFLEIEDTPGSERGNDDGDPGVLRSSTSSSGAPKIRKGSRIVVEKDRERLKEIFQEYKKKYPHRTEPKVEWSDQMEKMLGREFIVKAGLENDAYELPSPDGRGGSWFPAEAVQLKIALDLPVDKFLNLDVKEFQKLGERSNLKERSQFKEALQHPFSAYERPIRHPDEDRTITKQRMGYFICFDLSDDEGESLKEAMKLHQMLNKALEKKKHYRARPKAWLVGCKEDKSGNASMMRRNRESARRFSSSEEIPFATTSARDHKGVRKVFDEMIQAISASEILWRMEDADDEDNLEDTDGGCSVQ